MANRKLQPKDLDELIRLYLGAPPHRRRGIRTKLALRFGVCSATVTYSLKKRGIGLEEEQMTEAEREEYLIREKQASCSHPSFRCSVCNFYQDHAKTLEYSQMQELRRENAQLKRQLGRLTFQ